MGKRMTLVLLMVLLIFTTVFIVWTEYVFAVNDINIGDWGYTGRDLMSVDNGNTTDNTGYYFKIDSAYTNSNYKDTANDFNSGLPDIFPLDTSLDFEVHYTMDFSTKDQARINKGDLTLYVGGIAYGNPEVGYDDKLGFRVTAVGSSNVELVNKFEIPGLIGSSASEWYFEVAIPAGTTSLLIDVYSGKHSEGASDAGLSGLSVKIIDSTGPQVEVINSNISNSTLGVGDTASIYVRFDESVVVSGVPTIGLNSGGTAVYQDGSGTDTLRFEYTIAEGQNTPEGQYLSYDTNATITLGTGVAIKDPAGNSANVTLDRIGATNTLKNERNIKIDGTYPTVADIKVFDKNNSVEQNSNVYLSAAAGDSINIKVYLSESVSVSGTPILYLNNGQTATFVGTETHSVNKTVLRFKYDILSAHTSKNKDTEALNIDFSKTGTTYFVNGIIQDTAGNGLNRSLSAFSTNISSKNLGIDNTKPNLVFGENSGTNWAQSHYINVDVTDSHSGILGSEFKYHWSESSSPPDWSTISTKHPDGTAIRLDKSVEIGQYYLHINAIDEKGNENTLSTTSPRKFDSNPPMLNFGETSSSEPHRHYWFFGNVRDYGLTQNHSGMNTSIFKHQWVKEGDTINENSSAWSNDYAISLEDPDQYGYHRFQVNSSGYPISHGNWKVVIEAIDNAGNSKRFETGYFHIDMTPPVLDPSNITNNPLNAEGYEKSYNITITAVDENNVAGDKDYSNGTVTVYYRWTDDTIAPDIPNDFSGWTQYSGTMTQGESQGFNGQKFLHITAKDNSQNVAQSVYKRFTFDNEGPTVNFDPNNNGSNGSEDIKQSASIDITINDTLTSVDSATIQYQWVRPVQAGDIPGGSIWYKTLGDGTQLLIDDNNWTIDNSLSYDTSSLDFTDGDWYLVIKSNDIKGNESISASNRFRLARYPLTGSLDIVANYTNTTTIDISLNATDMNTGEALEYMWVDSSGTSINGSTWTGFSSGDTVTGVISNTEGNNAVYVKYRDSLGNISPVYSDTVTLDITDPTATTSYSEMNWTNSDVVVTFTLDDNYTPTNSITVTPPVIANVVDNGGNNEYRLLQNGSYEFILEDLAGNQGSCIVVVDNIDKQVPSINITSTDPGFVQEDPYQSVSVVINSTDNRVLESELDVYYQWSQQSDSTLVNDLDWINTTNGATASLDTVTGNYYLHVKSIEYLDVVSEENIRIFTSDKFILDNTPPIPTIAYDITTRTASPVKATITFDEVTTITAPADGKNYHIFDDIGEFIFEYVDRAGNSDSATAEVDWIDKSRPNALITYSTTELTNESVIVTIDVKGEPLRELQSFDIPADLDAECINTETVDGRLVLASYELRESGSLSFEVRDAVTGVINPAVVYVDNIDLEPPTADISYSTTEPTQNNVIVYVDAQDNSNMAVEVIPPDMAVVRDQGSKTGYEISENGDYTFTIVDAFGNSTTVAASIRNIDRMAPMASIWYMSDTWTNEPVKATITAYEPVEVLNNDGERTYEFIENGTFTFIIEDRAGNTSEVIAEVDWIDLELPAVEIIQTDIYRIDRETEELVKANEEELDIEYDSEKGLEVIGPKTNQHVEVFIKVQDNIVEEELRIIAPRGVAIEELEEAIKLTFTENDDYELKIEDKSGNITILPITIENIDKEPPKVDMFVSEIEPTNKDIIVYFEANEEIVVLPPPEAVVDEKLNTTHYIFSDNGIYEFIIEDLAGNGITKEITITNIDKAPPTGRIIYSNIGPTRDSVIATVKADEEFQVLNNFNLSQREFFKNGTYTFTIQDLAGNIVDVQAEVNNIDREPPNIVVQYSDTEYTNQKVTATLLSDEEFIVLNNNGRHIFEFEKNGTFILKVADMLGNETFVRANVENIDKDKPKLAFDLDRTPVFLQNEDYTLDDYVAYDEIDGDLTNRVQVDYNGFDIAGEGTFYIRYSVTDAAGNTTMVTRKAVVVSPYSYRIFANGMDPNFETLIFDNPKIIFDILNSKGEITIRWKQKKLTKGELKSRSEMLYHNEFTATQTGWHTFYIQDQERNGQLIQIYITSTDK